MNEQGLISREITRVDMTEGTVTITERWNAQDPECPFVVMDHTKNPPEIRRDVDFVQRQFTKPMEPGSHCYVVQR